MTAASTGVDIQEFEPLLAANQAQIDGTRREIEQTAMQAKVAAERAGAPQLATPTQPATPDAAAAAGPLSWRVRIAADRSEAEISRLAGLASARGEGTPEIYAKGSMFYLFLGRFPTREAATERVGDYKRLLGKGALVQNIDVICPSPRRRGNIWQCAGD